MTKPRPFALGSARSLTNPNAKGSLTMPTSHLLTHAVIVGASGSGKTGLVTVLVEEALRSGVPTLVLDVKGDLPNLLLALPSGNAEDVAPWVHGSSGDAAEDADRARAIAESRASGLATAGIDDTTLAAYRTRIAPRLITPGSSAGEGLHVLSSLERRSSRWDTDPESARESLSAAVSLVLRLLDRDPDPAKSREHVLLTVLAERRFARGEDAELGVLIADLLEPPIHELGALELDDFVSAKDRHALAASLNALVASPSFSGFRSGASLDVGAWLASPSAEPDARTPCVVLSVAHLDEEERVLVLGLVLEEVHAWVRTLPGTDTLRAMVMFDEVYGYLPPHPAKPPTKRPLVALFKQARAFGVGVVIATQNAMDLDYRALGNAGVWCIGRLQTDADRVRVVDGLAKGESGGGLDAKRLAGIVGRLAPRWFVVRDARADESLVMLQPRETISLMRGPMTRTELRRARNAWSPAEPG